MPEQRINMPHSIERNSLYLFVNSESSADFHIVMRQKGIIVERIQHDHPQHCFKIVYPLQGDTTTAGIAQWEEIEYWRGKSPQAY